MPQFATSADLAVRLGVPLTSDEETRADTLLGLSSALIQREARQLLELVTDDVLNMPGTSEGRLRLPERPVVSVSAVMIGALVINVNDDGSDPTGYVLVGDMLFRRAGWGYPDQMVQITYTHGYDPVPDAIRAVCMEPVVRVWVNPGNVVHEQYGSERNIYAVQNPPAGLLLNDEEQRVIHDTIRRTAGSVALR